MRKHVAIAGLFLMLYQSSFPRFTVSGDEAMTQLVRKPDAALTEFLNDPEPIDQTSDEHTKGSEAVNEKANTADSENTEPHLDNGPRLQDDMDKIDLKYDVLLRAFENEKRLSRIANVEFGSALDQLLSEVKDIMVSISTNWLSLRDLEQRMMQVPSLRETIIKLEKQVADLILSKKFMEEQNVQVMSMQQLVKENTEKLSAHINRLSGSLQLLSKEVGDHKEHYLTAFQKAVDQREKCQSGDDVGPHSFGPRPKYPVVVTVNFNPAFKKRPEIVYGLKKFDSDSSANIRMRAKIVELTNEHFKLKITDWSDTVMYGAVFSWMACPT